MNMKDRPKVPQKTKDELLIESRHRCNVCTRDVVQMHHIYKIDSKKGNNKSNLIVLCPECHRRAHLPSSYFEQKITKNQLKIYKNKWLEVCKRFPFILEKPIIVYCFLNRPRIESLFNQIASDLDKNKIEELEKKVGQESIPAFKNAPLERMMESILQKIGFINLETMEKGELLSNSEAIEGFPVYIGKRFYGHGLKGPHHKYNIKEFPYLHQKQKIGNKFLSIRINYNPEYILSMTGYMELSGNHRLSCYGVVKRVVKDTNEILVEIMPLAIGLRQPICSFNTFVRQF